MSKTIKFKFWFIIWWKN